MVKSTKRIIELNALNVTRIGDSTMPPDEIKCTTTREILTADNFVEVIVRGNNKLAEAMLAVFHNQNLLLQKIRILRNTTWGLTLGFVVLGGILMAKGIL
jgi:hypothetical protein